MASTSAQAPREGETPCRSARGRMPSQASINQQLSAFKSISAQAPLVPDQCGTKWNTCTDKFKWKPWLECELITASNLQRSWMTATLTGRSRLQHRSSRTVSKPPKYWINVFWYVNTTKELAPLSKLSIQTAVSFHVISKFYSKKKE